MKRSLQWLAITAILLATVGATIAIRAPAAWLGDWLEAHGKFRLLDARGTVWHGSALLGISDGRETTLVPGRIEWTLDSLGPSRIAARVSHPWLAAPLAVAVASDGATFAKGSARLPAGVLAGVGAPFNTLRPGGMLDVAWTDSRVRGGTLAGEVQIEWRDAQSALSTVAPLGSYRLRVRGSALDLETIGGPLKMQGKGTMEGSRVRFSGTAWADPAMQGALNGLLGLLGMRSGDKVLLAIDT